MKKGEVLQFAICRDMTIGRVFASESNPYFEVEGELFLDAVGVAPVIAGEILSVEALPSSLRIVIAKSPKMLPGSRYAFRVFSPEADGRVLRANFDLKEGEAVPEGAWLHPDGTTTPTPCKADE